MNDLENDIILLDNNKQELYEKLVSYLSDGGRIFDLSGQGGAKLSALPMSDREASLCGEAEKKVVETHIPGDPTKHERTCQVLNQYPLFAVLDSTKPGDSKKILMGPFIENK